MDMVHKIAIVGCGGMEATHQEDIGELGDRVDVVAAVDPVLDRAAAVARSFGHERFAGSVNEVMDDFEAALVVTPHDTHHQLGVDLLRAGKHVLMEKPLAISEEECLDLVREAEEADRVLMVAYPMRYHPLVLKLREAIEAGAVGTVFQISIWTEQYTHFPEGHWANTVAGLGGGQFFSHGCHYVDLLLWFLGRPVRGTHTGTRLGTPWMEGEGTSNVSIEFEGGALGYHFGTWGAKGTKLGYSIHVHGTEGMIEADISAGTVILRTPEGETTLAETTADNKFVHLELAHFLDVVEGRSELQTDPGTSLQGLRVIWRLYEAEQRGLVADLRGLGFDEPWRVVGLDKLPD